MDRIILKSLDKNLLQSRRPHLFLLPAGAVRCIVDVVNAKADWHRIIRTAVGDLVSRHPLGRLPSTGRAGLPVKVMPTSWEVIKHNVSMVGKGNDHGDDVDNKFQL